MAGDTPGMSLCSNPPLSDDNVDPDQIIVFSAQSCLDSGFSFKSCDEQKEKKLSKTQRSYKSTIEPSSSFDNHVDRCVQDREEIIKKKGLRYLQYQLVVLIWLRIARQILMCFTSTRVMITCLSPSPWCPTVWWWLKTLRPIRLI